MASPVPVKTSVTELPESRVRVQAEVPAEEVERRIQQAAKELGAKMRIPGFRKGKVPPPVVISRLGRGAVLDQALRSALGSWYVGAIDDAGIATVGEPEFDLGELPGEGEPLAFSIEIGVRPVAQLGAYRGLEVGRREPEADEARIEEQIEALRERSATLERVERPAAMGDHVVIDFLGRVDGEAFDGGEGRDQLLELGSGRLVPGFEDQLVGAAVGEQRSVEVTFPEEYPAHLSGKAAQFEVTVNEVQAKRLPELDDEFAVEASEFDTLAELRADLATRLLAADAEAVEHEFEQAVLDAVVDEAQIDVPSQLIHARAHELFDQMLTVLTRQGLSKEIYLAATGKDEETLVDEAEPEAAQLLRREAVLAAVIAAEQIDPSDEEVLKALEPTAEREGTTPEELLAGLRKSERIDRLREELATRQAIDLLVREAAAITVEQAKARKKLWTPGREEAEPGDSEQLWTPGR